MMGNYAHSSASLSTYDDGTRANTHTHTHAHTHTHTHTQTHTRRLMLTPRLPHTHTYTRTRAHSPATARMRTARSIPPDTQSEYHNSHIALIINTHKSVNVIGQYK